MTLVTQEQQQDVADHVAEIERHTDAEFVVVLAKRADNYSYIPLLWAAAIALLVPIALAAFGSTMGLFGAAVAQIVTFIVLSLVFRVPAVQIHLIPKRVRYWRAANLARRQFLENNLHHTQAETGVLLFISEAEHYVEILADRGISAQVDQSYWQTLVDEFISAVKAGETHRGLITCIDDCGALLKEKVPATSQKNELPNRLVVLND